MGVFIDQVPACGRRNPRRLFPKIELMITDSSKLSASACVDVLIAAWNNANTIERAVRSALADDHVNRVIVIDDGSTDDTFSLVKSLRDTVGDRIVLRRLDRNKGPSAARNHGLELSTAPWIAILDGDDYFLPGRVGALLDASQGADFIADDQIQLGEDEDPAISGNFLIGHENVMTLDLATFVAKNISKGTRLRKEFGFLKPMMRRSFLDSQQLRYLEELRLGEDFALYARALAAGAIFRVIPSRTYVSVIRSNSISGNHSKRDLECLRDSTGLLQQLPTLTDLERRLVRQHFESIDARVQWLNVIDAVKMRSVVAFLSPFFLRWTTFVYLTSCLFEQVVVRSKKSLGLS
jgi:succinoglycan biosynthesis protein ExoU